MSQDQLELNSIHEEVKLIDEEVKLINGIECLCRYCKEPVDPKIATDIVAPCKCKTFVHLKCLKDWQDKTSSNQCEVCLTDYETEYTYECKEDASKKTFLIGIILFVFIINAIIPHMFYIKYDILFSKGIEVGTCSSSDRKCDNYYEYIPLKYCNCATSNSTNENTICYDFINITHSPVPTNNHTIGNITATITNSKRYHKCSKPSDVNLFLQRINFTLIWISDLAVDAVTLTLHMLCGWFVFKKLYHGSIDIMMIHLWIYFCGAILYGLRSIPIGILNGEDTITIDDFYLHILIGRIIMYVGAYLIFGVIIIIIKPDVKQLNSLLIGSVLTGVCQIILHCIGLFITQVVFMKYDNFRGEGWNQPNFYNYGIGCATVIIVFIGLLIIYGLRLLISNKHVKLCTMGICFDHKEKIKNYHNIKNTSHI
jgi:hypothetical protein